MKPGDIWIVRIPHLSTHEQSGVRPTVVIARVAKTVVTIIPLTANKAALRFPYTCRVEPSKTNGLRNISIALVFQMRTIDVRFFDHKAGVLDKITLTELRTQAHRLIG